MYFTHEKPNDIFFKIKKIITEFFNENNWGMIYQFQLKISLNRKIICKKKKVKERWNVKDIS